MLEEPAVQPSASCRSRQERRALAQRLAAEYSVPFSLAWRTVERDVWARCEALANRTPMPANAFLAAAQVLTAERRS